MRISLTTFQGNTVRYQLGRERVYRARWHRSGPANPWNRAYRWMAKQMARRGLPTCGRPPIWAWPRERYYGGPPNFGTTYALLSEIELERGIWIIDLSVPSEFCVLSSYAVWNSVLDDFIAGKSIVDVPQGLFGIQSYRFPWPCEPDSFQFTLPHIDSRWIRAFRPLPYSPETVDWNKRI